MSKSELAILGGQAVRRKPFVVEPMVDEEEERFVLAAIREKSFSRYVGSTSQDIEAILRVTSAEAAAIEDDWHFLGGPNVRAFSAEFAKFFHVPYAIPINSATSGIGVALAAAGVGPGDEVIVPAISFTATASAVLMFNAVPVFVDVDPQMFCLDPAQVEKAITPQTRAIIPVHLAGNVADMGAILAIAKRHRLKVIEDAAQAIGACWDGRKAGTLGDAGVFSFQQSKNIMTGEGGMIVTHDQEIARRSRLILNHGEVVFDERHGVDDLANIVGLNLRMPELCAAVGRAQLKKLEAVNGWRTRNADLLRAELAGLPGLRLPPSQRQSSGPAREVPHMLVVLHDAHAMGISRGLFVAAMRAEGVPVGTGYTRPLYANPTFLQKVAYGREGCPWTCQRYKGSVTYARGQCQVAERLLDQEFLWFYHIAYPSTEEDMRDIGRAVRKVVEARQELSLVAPALTERIGPASQGRLTGTTQTVHRLRNGR